MQVEAETTFYDNGRPKKEMRPSGSILHIQEWFPNGNIKSRQQHLITEYIGETLRKWRTNKSWELMWSNYCIDYEEWFEDGSPAIVKNKETGTFQTWNKHHIMILNMIGVMNFDEMRRIITMWQKYNYYYDEGRYAPRTPVSHENMFCGQLPNKVHANGMIHITDTTCKSPNNMCTYHALREFLEEEEEDAGYGSDWEI